MINRLSNPINRNRSAAKISKVMSSSLHPARAGVDEHRPQDVLPHHGPSRRLADQEGRGLRSQQAGFWPFVEMASILVEQEETNPREVHEEQGPGDSRILF